MEASPGDCQGLHQELSLVNFSNEVKHLSQAKFLQQKPHQAYETRQDEIHLDQRFLFGFFPKVARVVLIFALQASDYFSILLVPALPHPHPSRAPKGASLATRRLPRSRYSRRLRCPPLPPMDARYFPSRVGLHQG